jgi:hypothetical protein
MRAPIFWATNHQPTFKEASEAIVSRLVIVPCRRHFDQANPIGVAALAARRRLEPAELVLATEREGLLAWAVAGLRRAAARGHFVLPEHSQEAAADVRRDSNMVAEFVETCISFDPLVMVPAADFGIAFCLWWEERKGGKFDFPSGDVITKALKALGDDRIGIHRTDLKYNHRRHFAGIELNAEGQQYWRSAMASDDNRLMARKAQATHLGQTPTYAIPEAWDGREVVINMRRAQQKQGTGGQNGARPAPTSGVRGGGPTVVGATTGLEPQDHENLESDQEVTLF